jgi:hypothetical protein
VGAADSAALRDVPGTAEVRLRRSLQCLEQWVVSHGYKAYDPGDGQMSPLAALAFRQERMERLLTAAILRAPINVRPLLGIRPHCSTKGMGYMAWGYLKRYRVTLDERDLDKARHCLEWLLQHRSPRRHHCWGNDFTFTTRAGRIPKGEPTIVWSALIGQAFLEACELLGEPRYLQVARSVCKWILEVPRARAPQGVCLSYVDTRQLSIHNANMLGAALLARVGAMTGDSRFRDLAQAAMRYSCACQRHDGAWFYGEDDKYHWVDNFHTGYNLDSLKRYIDSTGDRTFERCLAKGFRYYVLNFVEPDGRPRYTDARTLPVDIQCAAQCIDTLSYFGDLSMAWQVAEWTIEHMQDRDGHFHYRDLGWMKIKTPMFHWGQATMFKALAQLAERLHAAGSIPLRKALA